MLLDDAMPRPYWNETHRIAAAEPSDDLLRAFDDLTWAEVPAFRALMGVRGLLRARRSSDARVLDWFVSSGFVELERTDDEILIVSTQAVVPKTPETPVPRTMHEFRDFAEPGCIRIAFNVSTARGHLATVTRVDATDARAQRVFAAYWMLIRPWSGLIRRVWLRAIRARARKAVSAGSPQSG